MDTGTRSGAVGGSVPLSRGGKGAAARQAGSARPSTIPDPTTSPHRPDWWALCRRADGWKATGSQAHTVDVRTAG